jgi:hypothetical protein
MRHFPCNLDPPQSFNFSVDTVKPLDRVNIVESRQASRFFERTPIRQRII